MERILTEGEKRRLERGTPQEVYWGAIKNDRNNIGANDRNFEEVIQRIQESNKYKGIRIIEGSFDNSGHELINLNDIWVIPNE